MRLSRNEHGFTLTELMVVVIIIGILAAIAVPAMSSQQNKAKTKRTVSELKSMKTIIDIYMADSVINAGGYAPKSADTTNAGDIKKVLSDGGFNTANTDPWGTKYHYQAHKNGTGTTYYLYSYGPDKTANTPDDISVTESANPRENIAVTAASDPAVDHDLE